MTWAETRKLVWERDGGICGLCQKPVAFEKTMHLDHIVERCHGGTDELGNLRPSHARCNTSRKLLNRPPRTYGRPKLNRESRYISLPPDYWEWLMRGRQNYYSNAIEDLIRKAMWDEFEPEA